MKTINLKIPYSDLDKATKLLGHVNNASIQFGEITFGPETLYADSLTTYFLDTTSLRQSVPVEYVLLCKSNLVGWNTIVAEGTKGNLFGTADFDSIKGKCKLLVGDLEDYKKRQED